MRIGIIGYGNIGETLCGLIKDHLPDAELRVLVRPGRETPWATVTTAEELLVEPKPDLVVECAGHGAVSEVVPKCLNDGVDCVVASVGALSDDVLYNELKSAAERGGSRLILPAGALGGLDLLAALRPGGIERVRYEGRKPPAAWKGSPAEGLVDLDRLSTATPFFQGSARDAARDFPKNANVAAALALAGIGFDRTEVTLIADPQAQGNTHSYWVTAGAAEYEMTIAGKPSPGMARTSAATVYSLLREVLNRAGPIVV
ncbi:MAG: aspartate dehydrogenase [Pseudomonadota bacterium]